MSAHVFYRSHQEKRLARAISLAGARYTPKLNVEVSIASVFDGIGRTADFYDELKRPANELAKHLGSVNHKEIDAVIKTEYERARKLALDFTAAVLKIPTSGVRRIEFKKLSTAANKAQKALRVCIHELEKIEQEEREKRKLENAQPGESAQATHPIDSEKYRNETHYLRRAAGSLYTFCEFAKSPTAAAANNPRILLKGIAGSGKTHFLCDLSKHRIAKGLPTFIFLGEEFNTKKPLDTIKGLLNVTASNQQFLTALNKFAAAKRTRAIIVVDAVNESQVTGVYWEELNRLKNFSNLGVVLSVRTGFEQTTVAQSIHKNYVQVEHHGFAEHEWQALTKFFTEYKLPLPEVPILFSEFRVPLFLKIFCEASAKSPTPIKGNFGFTHIFEKYVIFQGASVLEKLNESGESARRIWDGTIKELALYMGEHGVDRIPEKAAISIAAKEFPSKGRRVLGLLEKYWLLTKVPRYKKYKIVGFDYRFPYQKFSDHLIVRSLLKHLNKSAPEESFKKGTVLGNIIADQWNSGLIEALSIQVPERLGGRELVYVAPKKFRLQMVAKDSFLESLIWRDLSLKNGRTKFINQAKVLNYINKYILPYQYGHEKILETILTVAAIPNHPLNAELLYGYLAKRKMAQRDALWLPFINTRLGGEGAVNRLIAWAWDGNDKSKIQDASLRLAGITLAWFLASSNRFMRDKATKALISMLRGRIPVLIKILETFKKVDDPYIQERLFAVAYGSSLQVDNKKEDVSKLGLYVYNTCFKNRKPPAHILLRDYARGTVETALSLDRSLEAKIDLKRVRPPYGSAFPKKIPSLAELTKKYGKDYTHVEKNYSSIWSSLMYGNGGGIADFGNYVVGSSLRRWSNLRLSKSGKIPKTAKDLETEFNANLSRKEMNYWKKLEGWRHSADFQIRMFDSPYLAELTKKKNEFTKEQLEAAQKHVRELENKFIHSLSPSQQSLYKKGVLLRRQRSIRDDEIDNALVQRIIFQRVIDLGWRPKLFGKYDSELRDTGRDSHKSERIGKKYQWIAYHETLGRIADNFLFKKDWGDGYETYEGVWQTWRRDIDPSFLLPRTPIDSTERKPWWIAPTYKKWSMSLTHTEWTARKDDLPNQKRLIDVRARGGWLLLGGFLGWEQPPIAGEGERRYDRVSRDLWYIVRSYLVKKPHSQSFFDWAKKQDFMGRWMPEPREMRSIFLNEFPMSTAYRIEHNPDNKTRLITISDKQNKSTNFKVVGTTEEYHWEGSNYDCSIEEGVAIHLPAQELIKGMKLKHGKDVGTFVDKNGVVVALDPSVANIGSGSLLVKKKPLLEFLKENNYDLFWAITGEKVLVGTNGGGNGFLGRLEMGGAFRMKSDGKLSGKSYTKVFPAHKE